MDAALAAGLTAGGALFRSGHFRFAPLPSVVPALARRVPPFPARNSFDACFAPDEAKKRWKTEADDFAARNAPVAG